MDIDKIFSIISCVSRLISEPGNPQYIPLILVYYSFHAFNLGYPIDKITVYFLSCGLGLFICGIFKALYPSKRPCIHSNHRWDNWCKEKRDTNMPSAHAFIGIYSGLVLMEYSKTESFECYWLVVWLMSFPFLRYIGRQHTGPAVVVGSFIGLLNFIIAKHFIDSGYSCIAYTQNKVKLIFNI